MAEDKKEAVMKAFLEMNREMPLEEIRTEELIRRAGVSKSTFYRMFRDKYDVMNAIYLSFSRRIVHEDPSLYHWKSWTLLDLQYVKKHRAFFRGALSYEGQNSIRSALGEYFQENILREVGKDYPSGEIPPKVLFQVRAFVQVNVFALTWWVMECCSCEPETVVDYVDSCIPPELRRYFEKGEA